MDSLVSSSSCIGAIPITTGQTLTPNARYFASYDCDDFSLPSRAILKEGDTFEILRTLEPKLITMNIPNGLFFDKSKAFENSFPWSAYEGTAARHSLKIIYNGLDFQLQEYSANASVKAIRNGSKEFKASGTFTVPIGVSKLKVTVVGAGAGGGSGAVVKTAANYAYAQAGSGGGGGAVVIAAIVPVSSNQIIPITIGAAGAGGALVTSNRGKSGINGGDTSFGEFIICGGGERGLGGDSSWGESGSETSEPKAGGVGGKVQMANSYEVELAIEGGKGGDSGRASGNQSLATKGEDGESVNEFIGGLASAIDSRNGSAGGGGASAVSKGIDAIALSGDYERGFAAGGGGSRGQHYNYNAPGEYGNLNAASGHPAYILIEWERD